MKRSTFVIAGILSLIIVISGFIAMTLLHNFLLSLLLIAIGGIVFWFISKKAKKEDWFGKPAK